MIEQSPTQAPKVEITKYKHPVTGLDTAKASGKVGEHHLSIIPSDVGGFEVVVFGDDGTGEMDTTNELFYTRVDGTADDLEEIADTYQRRFESGVDPENLDQAEMDELSRSMDEFRKKQESQPPE